MCGIVGVVGDAKALEIIMGGLQRLEYRGYDSAGVALLNNLGQLEVRKAVGKLAALQAVVKDNPPSSASTGLGHTRWATHGAATVANAHPHSGKLGGHNLTVVHNGIIENFAAIKAELLPHGATFMSETDTEVIPFALANALEHSAKTLAQAVHAVNGKFHGHYAFVVMKQGDATRMVGTRRGAPLCVGLGEGANYLVSDPLALAGITSRFMYLEDGDVVVITPKTVEITDENGKPAKRAVKVVDQSADMAGKMGYRHFMLKEINEQPAVVSRVLQAHTNSSTMLPALPLGKLALGKVPFINIVACGTAYYAGLVGKYYLEQLARVPVNVDVASEFRYRNPPYVPGGLFIAVSQSGETADTLAALQHAKAAGQHTLLLTNVPTSTMARTADTVVNLLAEREIAVASTKAFMAMITTLALLALQLAQARGMASADVAGHVAHLRTLPTILTSLITEMSHEKGTLAQLAERLQEAKSMLYLGRGSLAPMALEGALKMKEISYIHSEGYASGEMKHGPIALVDKELVVVNLAASHDGLFEKTISNLKEVEARHGQIVLMTDAAGANQLRESGQVHSGMVVVEIPAVPQALLPMAFAVPLQLLAYFTATMKGTDVDQPRNLAKSVTVE